jgi:LemA protein
MMKAERGAGAVLAIFGIVAIVLVVLGVVLFMWYVGGYNKAVRLDESVTQAWADVDAQIQRRFDLVPNLVETVKGITQQEQAVFGKIAEARTKYMNAQNPEGKMQASNMLSSVLPNLLALREAYPELKSNESFLALQDQLEGTENRISVARTRYNEAVRLLNTYAGEYFGSFFCRKAGVEKREPFETTQQAKTEVPKVNFNAPQPQSTP